MNPIDIRSQSASVMPQVQTLGDTAAGRAQVERMVQAADAFEVINGRVVQVRDPITGVALPGVSKDFA